LEEKEKTVKIRIPNHLFWMLSLLIIVSLACQGNSPTVEPTPTADTQAMPGGNSAIPSQVGIAPIGLPDKRENQAGDEDSSTNADRKLVSGGEKFVKGLYERPFNAQTMDTYFPYLDIVDTQGFKDDTWGFATITMSGTDTNGHLPGDYGVELDLNRDGRGEWLILVSNPSSADWTTQGVQAWNDANSDVGGKAPTVADENSPGDGYEALVFDQGKGVKVDDAWVRVSGEDPKTITIAFKLSLIGNPESFAMGAWAGSKNSLNPALFDFNDHMTHIEAGSPLPDFYVYPIKKLAEIDNTCRMAIGFVPTGNEPGLCETYIKDNSGQAPVGCTPSYNAAGGPSSCP
jgi:hypothetical protein